MKIAYFALISLFTASVCLAGETDDALRKRSRKALRDLEKRYSKIRDAVKYADVKFCKSTVKQLLTSATTESKRKILAVEFCENLNRSNRFRYYEYYLLWFGGRNKLFRVAQNKALVLTLVKKIDARKSVKDWELRRVYCILAIEILTKLVDHKPATPINLGNYKIDWKAWGTYATWLRKNHKKLVFDKASQKFRLPPTQ